MTKVFASILLVLVFIVAYLPVTARENNNATIALVAFPDSHIAEAETKTNADDIARCKSSALSGARNVVGKEYGDYFIGYTIKAINDVMYHNMNGEYQCMANVLVVVYLGTGYSHRMIHLHWTQDGGFRSASYFYDWIEGDFSVTEHALRVWCDFIKTVYPQELKEQRCE